MKNQFSLATLIFFFFISFVNGQQIHTPAEIYKIMEKSPISYELNELKEVITPPDRSENLNYNHYYRAIENNSIVTYKYNISDSAKIWLSKAEKHFNNREFSLARDYYIKTLEVDSTYFQVMTYIGQTYGIQKQWDKAIEWYQKTIKLNYIDYMAHWFLADAYKVNGEIEKALDEITIAFILNRNNPRIKKSLDEIYKLNKLKYNEWTFTPQMKIDSVGINKVKISFDIDWLGYAMVKALWEYEPGYRESMGVGKGSFSTIEEKEAFVSLMNPLKKKKIKKNPVFKALYDAVNKEMIDEFIIFEIVLPEHPFVAYQFDEKFINHIKNYVLTIRGNKK